MPGDEVHRPQRRREDEQKKEVRAVAMDDVEVAPGEDAPLTDARAVAHGRQGDGRPRDFRGAFFDAVGRKALGHILVVDFGVLRASRPLLGRQFRFEFFVDAIEIGDAEVLERLIRRAVVGEVSTAGEEGNLVAEHHVLGRVGDEDDGVTVVGELAQEPHELAFDAWVEAGCRLIEEEEARFREEFRADGDAFALASAE